MYRNSGFLITGMIVSSAGGVALCCRKSGSMLPEGWLSKSGQVAQEEPEYSSDRYLLDNTSVEAYRGDCYTNTVTIRLNRNFVDSDVPVNEHILDNNT